jgi:hypothetical protein
VSKDIQQLRDFVEYAGLLRGDEKGEAQVFCDRLFRAFRHQGYKEAGATLEYRIKKKSAQGTSFADLVWKPRLLIEMKRRGEKLYLHYKQWFRQKSGGDSAVSPEFVIAGMIFHPSRV